MSGVSAQNKLLHQIQRIDMCRIVDVKERFVRLSAFAVIQQQQRKRQNHETLKIELQQRFRRGEECSSALKAEHVNHSIH